MAHALLRVMVEHEPHAVEQLVHAPHWSQIPPVGQHVFGGVVVTGGMVVGAMLTHSITPFADARE